MMVLPSNTGHSKIRQGYLWGCNDSLNELNLGDPVGIFLQLTTVLLYPEVSKDRICRV